LPDVTPRGFWLDGRRWHTPHPDDAEALVDGLVRRNVLVRDPMVAEALRGGRPRVSSRTVERRFRAATGLTRGGIEQIGRVRVAAGLLAGGKLVEDVVGRLGYYDEPHLARMLRRYVGRSAQQLRTGEGGALALDLAQFTTS
jgi:methylphosphotriester-DNA--protein-cysteine methyltransferase